MNLSFNVWNLTTNLISDRHSVNSSMLNEPPIVKTNPQNALIERLGQQVLR